MARTFAETAGGDRLATDPDNEFTLQRWGRCYCKYCRAGFQDWLRGKYGVIGHHQFQMGHGLLEVRYTPTSSQIPMPLPSNGDPNPGLALDYDRYQSFANASFLEEQLVMLRKMCPHHFVTTNNVGAPFDTLDLHELYRNLDFLALARQLSGFCANDFSRHGRGEPAEYYRFGP